MSAQTPSPVAAAEPGLELSGPAGGATGAAQHSEGAATGGGGGGEDCTAARAGAGGDNGASAPPIGDRVSGRRREGGVPTAAASMSGTAVKGAKARNSVASYLREKLAVATAGVPGRVQGGAQDQATVQTLGKEGARDETVVAVPRVRSRVVVPTGGKRAAAAPPMDTCVPLPWYLDVVVRTAPTSSFIAWSSWEAGLTRNHKPGATTPCRRHASPLDTEHSTCNTVSKSICSNKSSAIFSSIVVGPNSCCNFLHITYIYHLLHITCATYFI